MRADRGAASAAAWTELLLNAEGLGAAAGRRARDGLRRLGLSERRAALLSILSREERPTIHHLADMFQVRPSAISAVLMRMESDAVVEVMHRPGDRRSKVVGLTDKGRALSRQAGGIFNGLNAASMEGIAVEDLSVAAAVLQRIVGNIAEAD